MGPDGAITPHIVNDVELQVRSLIHVVDTIRIVNPTYQASVMTSVTTLLTGNLFAEMRDGVETPLVLQFARRFSATTREMMKRMTSCSFKYFTSPTSFYTAGLLVL